MGTYDVCFLPGRAMQGLLCLLLSLTVPLGNPASATQAWEAAVRQAAWCGCHRL